MRRTELFIKYSRPFILFAVKTSSDAGDEHLLNVSVESLLSNDDVALEFECNSSNSIAFMRLK